MASTDEDARVREGSLDATHPPEPNLDWLGKLILFVSLAFLYNLFKVKGDRNGQALSWYGEPITKEEAQVLISGISGPKSK